ncbi:His Kinase A (phospho-acceptor) domain-containing protein [Paenibacillus sp. UNCCL117]|uniref:ATP-binding protein n=1 Tax=unclassified Paenibacillus TaxID=185978 RepID=UPI000882D1F2|nr:MULTISPECIES: ATP-binding protein [unclassified Paenibacillus]SDC25320.1 His Kinase A (phospho-acceptor) domain-containing protein [Paenibacillus sp. cl123]SFW19798.1 His Kinase A (phospho-acceptor) domain-containing protein [Paenibacillus sp. UNCCL117]
MKKQLAAAAITLVLLLATYGVLFAYLSPDKKQPPIAANGSLDLTSWHFADDGVVALDGEWEFYPGRLAVHDDLAAPTKAGIGDVAAMIQVPGTWSARMETLGVATYRLQLRVGDNGGVYGLKTASIQLANRLFVNGELVGSSGNPADDKTYSGLNKPYVSYFALRPGWNELLLQAANYDLPISSGINESIYLGTTGQIAGMRDKALMHDWVTVTAFLIMGLYFVGLYSQRKHDLSLLVFGLVCVSIALFTSTRGERVLFDAIGELPFWLYYRIQMISASGCGFGFFLYIYTAFRPFCSERFVRGCLMTGVLLALLYLGFASELTTLQANLLRQLTTFYIFFSLLYATYVFVLAALHKVEGSRYLIFAAIALHALSLNQNRSVYFGMPVYSTVPFEPFLVLLMLALLMSLRFSNAFHKIEELTRRLLQADKMKDDFLARTSHEFKSPLHGVIHISRSMLEDTVHPPTPAQREKLELITGIMNRLTQLVYDILDLAKLKQGELRVVTAPTDVRSVVDVQVQIYTYVCRERNIRLTNLVPADLSAVLADESRLSQIIGNLLDNAAQHTENGTIVVSGKKRDNMIEIAVQDTGKGIASRDIPLIFVPFQTIDGAERRGAGLGLSIAKQLVELQQGSLTVDSTPGVGSTFRFTLPIATQKKEARASRSETDISPKPSDYTFVTPYDSNKPGKHTVLIVDDQFVNLKVLMEALQNLDYRVIAVKNGYEALEQINGPVRIDLVILDLMMPGMSGYEVCQEIRKRYSLLELPVLMVTAAIQPQDKVAAFQAGANDYLPKPFDVEEMKARIGSLLAMKEQLGKAIHLEVAFLQSQIKPHFLFNVLNSIVASSYTDVDGARKMIIDFADYLRGSFRFSNAEGRISFEEEYQLIRTYVSIEQARFKNRIQFESDIEEAAYELQIPPLLLQPLVENAIRHGIGNRLEGGTVSLTVHQTNGQWRFVVADNGVGIEPERLETLLEERGAQGVGLLNINKRLKHEYGVQLEVESEAGRGTKITVRMPASSI